MIKRALTILLSAASICCSQIVIKPLATSGGTNSLNNDLIAFWNMNETSGTRYDTTANDNDLTDNNTVGYAAGMIGSGADFEYSNHEYLTIADNYLLSFGAEESFTLAAWIKLESGGNYRPIIAKTNGSATINFEYNLDVLDSNKPRFFTGNGSGASSAEWGSTISTGTWYCIIGWYDTIQDSVYIQVNNGDPVKSLAVYEPHDGTDPFKIGTWSGVTWYMDGLIDLVGVWGRCPTYTNGYAMADSIYNNGNGWKP